MISLYRAFFPFFFLAVLFLGAPFSKKVRQGLKLRKARLKPSSFKGLEQCFLIHAASGEYEYARPLINELKQAFPHIPVVVTFFSPSFVKNIDADPLVDFSIPLPFDFPGPTRSFLKKMNPLAVFIARTDLWPEFLQQCHRLKIPTVLFSYFENPRKNFLLRILRRGLLKKLSHIDCVDEKTFERLREKLKVSLSHFGDTRYDRVLQRMSHPKDVPFAIPAEKRVVVLGSTWKEDEKIILPALKDTKGDWDHVIVAPHEPTAEHIKNLKSQLKKNGLSFQLFSESTEILNSQVLIVDQVGWLFDLYRFATLSFVGGSFKGSVHSVMEPLAFGSKVLLGPYMENNREAVEFKNLDIRGQFAVEVLKDKTQVKSALKKYLAQSIEERELFRSEIKNEIIKRSGASRKLVQRLMKDQLI